MSKIMFAGDTHGDTRHVESLCRVARRHEVDTIFVLGDFGFIWSGTERIDALHNVLEQFEINLFWLDGNHENFTLMAELGMALDSPTPVKYGERITYMPRGYVFDDWGPTIMTMGGAYSIDEDRRIPGASWWSEETIKYADYERALANARGRKIDILLAHDAPEVPDKLHEFLFNEGSYVDLVTKEVHPYKMDQKSQSNRLVLGHMAGQARPRLIMHGHYHHRYNGMWNGIPVVGLSNNGTQGSNLILDLDRLDEEITAIMPERKKDKE